ncbi:hypothetical protein CO115_01270 [Candidatus Falkowbacteria bacterium CG_4_9_14_3_um_filter_36_9]|uniref:Uncharacterized protein n=1 Tax=Candidatus Falkowbacteria bacterium CG02_land_8_20_14_3_00_36_14 TaxID=1974560 RepID=A0A2M7DQY0_9BACT|nr:MAG: hypothetical protein COS18_00160 [Candidatus Falkowbacteria bacterium CG02_land_8_20_14_3_00_36_14]PIX10932.1 MAG: hypothetical protein COZ73_03965 [Candidatus Falkowbacteria bacterium CG_4_8_14_3_um_filter_36_11]PJA10995.1 MAG: hypothetical protein COX67_02080 [Candidatus Falkowbacteria bacterium CG_4_10_14_0_2_um_filter_36_22]PJB20461.1 MAG: hypothetical protein CO115_01270 [Candidatus Falkowbacteria bacterium CG_4_9_14_3_um_filter_36_9]
MNNNINKKIIITCFLFLFFSYFFVFSNICLAQDSLIDKTLSDKCKDPGCELNDLMSLVITISDMILKISGSLALLFFIYGGVLFLISAGNSEMVEKAKKVLIGSTVGIVIVFTSFMIIGFTLSALGVIDSASNTAWAEVGWFKK